MAYPKVAEAQRVLNISGRLYIAEFLNKDKLWLVGDYQGAKLTFNPEDAKIENNQTVAGGSSAIYSRVKDAKIAFEAYNFNGTMLQQILGATVSNVAATALTTTKKAYSGGLLFLEKGVKSGGGEVTGIFDPLATITVKSADDSTTYVKDTDYAVENDGIRILVGGAIATLDVAGAGVTVKVTWTNKAAVNAEALTNLGREYTIIFKGEDGYNGGKAFQVILHKVRLAPTKDFMFTDGKEFKKAVLEGEILIDQSIPFSDVTSQYLVVNMVE